MLACVTVFGNLAYAQVEVPLVEANRHIGERAKVCGVVASVNYAERSPYKPTFFDLNGTFPHEVFTIVIWDEDRKNFPKTPPIEEKYRRGTQLCVTGKIRDGRSMRERQKDPTHPKPEISAKGPGQIEIFHVSKVP